MLMRAKRGNLTGLAAGFVAGLMLSVAVERAEAGKGGDFKSAGTHSIKPPPGPNVRDHRGGKQTSTSTAQGGVTVTSQPRKPRCRPGFLHACLSDPKGRDHRSN